MPESPRWDIRYGYHERAFNTMTAFYGVSRNHRAVATETAEINQNIKASTGNHPWWEVFTGPRMAYRTGLGMALQCLQQLTGANYFFYYGTTIFEGVGISNSYVTAMILGGVNFGKSCTTYLAAMPASATFTKIRSDRIYIPWPLYGGAFRSSQVSCLWSSLDVRVLHGFCLRRPLRILPSLLV